MDFQLPKAEPNKQLREKLETWELKELIKELEAISPGASENTPVDTKRRVIRAIEVAKDRGQETEVRSKKMDKHQSPIPDPRSSIPDPRSPVVLGVDYSRTVIRKLITTRLHFRLENGMIEEVESLLQNGVTHERMEILGLEYRFISRYLNGVYTKDEMTALLNTAIHQFAKKQMTFFRNMEKNGIKIHWIPEGDFETALEVISKG
jgi:tRNA dimethylallyltransferase